MGKKGL